MFDKGNEFGEHQGLGLFSGSVQKIPSITINGGKRNKIPHVGWFKLHINNKRVEHGKSIFTDISFSPYVYFVHSYMATLSDPNNLEAYYRCNEIIIPAMVRKENIYGSQFHLEKSGDVGLRIIKNFLNL